MGEDKRVAWEALKQQAAGQFGPEMVFGEGPLDARLALIGEAPGEQEVAQRRPFVGPAGRLLDHLLAAAGLRREDLYLTNTVKVRPTTQAGGRVKNRPPRVGEVKDGLDVLLPELAIVAPAALVLVGNIPAKALVGRDFAMGTGRGRWLATTPRIPALATYHPAYLLRLEGDDYDRVWEVIVGDLLTAKRGPVDGDG
ncbi:MAG TPA: uracil-DNA glycosylase [Thermomicrobiales bacterium]|nr:uracil-DNA glycosylase [Thermomicrobiales bacterium]